MRRMARDAGSGNWLGVLMLDDIGPPKQATAPAAAAHKDGGRTTRQPTKERVENSEVLSRQTSTDTDPGSTIP